MVRTISLDPKILVLKADTEEELKMFIELAANNEKKEAEDIKERIKMLSPEAQSLIGAFKGSPNLDKKEIRRERLKERYGIDIGID